MPLYTDYDKNAHRAHVDVYLAANIKTATRPRWSASRIIAAAEAAGWTVWDFDNDLHVTGTLVIEQSGAVERPIPNEWMCALAASPGPLAYRLVAA